MAYKYAADDPILIQNEKPKSSIRTSEVPNMFCCKFVVNIVAQTPQESKTKKKSDIKKIIFFTDKIQHTA